MPVGRVTAPLVFEMTVKVSELTKVVSLKASVDEGTVVNDDGMNVNV